MGFVDPAAQQRLLVSRDVVPTCPHKRVVERRVTGGHTHTHGGRSGAAARGSIWKLSVLR